MKTFLVVPGDPISQKNSGRRRVVHRGIAMIIPANLKAAKAYREAALVELRNQWHFAPAITQSVRAWYQIYRSDARQQDQGNALEAIWDAMQQAGVVANDRLILPCCLGPIKVDRDNPRVELHLALYADLSEPGRAVAQLEELGHR